MVLAGGPGLAQEGPRIGFRANPLTSTESDAQIAQIEAAISEAVEGFLVANPDARPEAV